MTVKDHLKYTRKLNHEIDALKRQRESLYYMVTGSSIPIREVDVQTSGRGDKLGEVMAKVADLDRKILDKIEELTKYQATALDQIQTLDKPEHRSVLINYYLNAYSWSIVADVMDYSIDRVYQFHREALKRLQ